VNELNNLNVNYLKIPKKTSRAPRNALTGHKQPAGREFETPASDIVDCESSSCCNKQQLKALGLFRGTNQLHGLRFHDFAMIQTCTYLCSSN